MEALIIKRPGNAMTPEAYHALVDDIIRETGLTEAKANAAAAMGDLPETDAAGQLVIRSDKQTFLIRSALPQSTPPALSSPFETPPEIFFSPSPTHRNQPVSELAASIGYSNFKDTVADQPDQRDKLPALGNLPGNLHITVWEKPDFAPIAKLFDDLFIKLGWAVRP